MAAKTTQRTLIVIQETATPHGNVMMRALDQHPAADLELWYFETKAAKYGFKNDLTHALKPAHLYPQDGIGWELVKRIWEARDAGVMLVGWANATTRAVFLMLCLLQRPFGMWFDMPQEDTHRSLPKRMLRELFYKLLLLSRAHIFAVGEDTVDYFKKRGFKGRRITNLPIMVDTDMPRSSFHGRAEEIRKRFGLKKDDLLFSAGSRLIRDKGFDIVIQAIGDLPEKLKKRVHCVIVGQGEEMENLKVQADEAGLGGQIHLPGWIEFKDYQALIANSIAFIHPARFDAWGATIFAHAIGVPVIGSRGAGSARERIQHGVNGWLFNPENPAELTACLNDALTMPAAKLAAMGKAALATAQEWSPTRGAGMIVEKL